MTENRITRFSPEEQENNQQIHRTKMQRDMIIKKLREKSCRITKQRLLIMDIILENECSYCKEIYYQASKLDSSIGRATVYRFIKTLEEVGAISRKNMYKVAYSEKSVLEHAYTVVLDDETTYRLSAQKWSAVLKAGLSACGYLKNQHISSIMVEECEYEQSAL